MEQAILFVLHRVVENLFRVNRPKIKSMDRLAAAKRHHITKKPKHNPQ